MPATQIQGVVETPLRKIATDGGAVLHGMRSSDTGYNGFGEAYFSRVESGQIRGWKRHHRMTLNIIVPLGEIRFVLLDQRPDSRTTGLKNEFLLSDVHRYCRLTVPPGIWMAFQGISSPHSTLLNLADIEHDPAESDQAAIDSIAHDWARLPHQPKEHP